MSNLLTGSTGQYIDKDGKTRMINYDNISLMISPIPPIDIPQIGLNKIFNSTLSQALKFIKNKTLEITKQDGSSDGIVGLWLQGKILNSGISFAYIPVELSPPIKDVEFSKPTKINPLKVEKKSVLENFRIQKKISTFMKQYVLYEYSFDPELFGENNFYIDPDHIFDIDSLDKKFIRENKVMYSGKKLIVPSIKIRQQLLSYLKIKILNDPNILEIKNQKFIQNYFVDPSDFKKQRNQIVFMNRKDLKTWNKNKEKKIFSETVTSTLFPDLKSPYFYRNLNIDEYRAFMIQNVKSGDLRRALSVGKKWNEDRINLGFNTEPNEALLQEKFEIYSEYENKKKVKITSVFDYGEDRYGAILFFN